MQLTGTGDNVLSRLLNVALHARIRLRQTLKTLNKLGQVTSVLRLDGNTHDRRHRELHDTNDRGRLIISDGTTLNEVLINTDKTNSVTTRAIVDGLDVSSHHENSTLDGLNKEILLGGAVVVGTHKAYLHTGLNAAREHTSKGVEASLIVGGHHLGHVHHEGSIGVTVADTSGSGIIHITSVQVLNTVLLRSHRGRQVAHDHFQKSISGGKELAHDGLKESLSDLLLLLKGKLDTKLFNHLLILGLLVIHDVGEERVNWLEDKLAPSTSEDGTILASLGLDPLLCLGIEVVVSPELLHKTRALGTELLGVHGGETGESETPSVETGSESNGTLGRADLDITEELVTVGGDNDVDVLNNLLESEIALFGLIHQLKEDTIHLVHHEHGLDTFTKSLTEHSLGLDTNTFDAIDDDEGTISDTKGSSHLRGEIDVAG